MITSRNNALIKRIRSLKDKKWREIEGVYVAEGIKSVKEAYSAGCDIEVAVGTEKALAQAEIGGMRIECVSEDVFKSISGEVSPQGLLCVIKKPVRNLSESSLGMAQSTFGYGRWERAHVSMETSKRRCSSLIRPELYAAMDLCHFFTNPMPRHTENAKIMKMRSQYLTRQLNFAHSTMR